MKRFLAFAVSLLLFLVSPGAPAYQAFAMTVGKTGPAVGEAGSEAANSANSAGRAGGVTLLTMPAQSLGLNGSLTPAPAIPMLDSAAGAPAVSGPAKLPPLKSAPSMPEGAGADVQSGAVEKAHSPAKSGAGNLETLSESAARLSAPNANQTGELDAMYENAEERADGGLSVTAGQGSERAALKKGAKPLSAASTAVPAALAPAAAKPGTWQRLKSGFDLSEFNKSEKFYILGQAVFLFAISVYLASLPLLVSALTGDAAMTGVARMVHYWVFGGASLFAGAVVSKTPMKRILVGAAGTRAAIFGTIGAFALFGSLPWAGFLMLVGVNALIVAHNHLVDIDTGGAAKTFKGKNAAETDRKIEKAGYVYDFIYYGMMLVVPALIGLPMDWLDARFGPGIGAAAGFSLFAALMATVSYIYAKKVVIIDDAVPAPLADLRDALGRMWSATRTFGRILVDIPRRNWAAFKIILGNKAILARSTMATMENFVEDALFAVVLPTFAIDILKTGAFGNGLLLSAITAGGFVASVFLMKRVQDLQKTHGTYKVLAGLTVVAALAFVPSIGLWMFPFIVPAMFAVFFMKLMLQPLRSRMRALLQTEIKNDPKAAPYADDIYGLMSFVEMLAAGAGGLAFAWLFHHSAAGSALALTFGVFAPMKIITLTLIAMGFVYFLGLRWVKSQLAKPTSAVRSPDSA